MGTPSAMQMFFEIAVFTAAIWLSGLLGKNPQAANQIALNLSSMTFMIAIGLSVTSMIRVGNQKGLENYRELRRIAMSIFLLALIRSNVFCYIIFYIQTSATQSVCGFDDVTNFKDNLEVVNIATQLLFIAAIFK